MKLRRLDREYAEVLKANIKTDSNRYEGLSNVLGIDKAEKEHQDEKENDTILNINDEDDGFGDF